MRAQSDMIIHKDLDELSKAGATLFAKSADQAVARSGLFSVALSGGSTPRGMHKLLGKAPFCSTIAWDQTHIFWVDERYVPFEDPASNYGAARKDFIDLVPVLKRNAHPMPVHMDPYEGAEHYQVQITDFFKTGANEIPEFDLILLGIGTDGHTASLFPGAPVLEEQKQFISSVKGGIPNVHRLTMTYPILNQARNIVFIASGEGKAAVIQALLERKQNLPARGINPRSGNLTWLLDQGAASLLQEK